MPSVRRSLPARLFIGLLLQTLIFTLLSSVIVPRTFDGDLRLLLIAIVSSIPVIVAVGVPFLRGELRWHGPAPSILRGIGLVLTVIAVSIVGGIVAGLVGKLCGALGWSTSTGVGVATSHVTFWGVIYACLLGPFIEELVWRGAVLGVLARYGRTLAIVLSAIGFGLFHHDVEQGISAACTGLFLGYVAWKWGLRYAIVGHILSNSWDTIASALTSTSVGNEVHLGNLVVALITVVAVIAAIMFLVSELKSRRTPDARASRTDVVEGAEGSGAVALGVVEYRWIHEPLLWAYAVTEIVLTTMAMQGLL